MPVASLAALLTVWTLALLIPGPDFLAVSHASVARSRRDAVFVGLGVAAAMAVWATTSLIGLTVLLVKCQPLFEAVRLAGAAYLLWLAFQLLRSAARRTTSGPATAGPRIRPRGAIAAFRAGFLCNIGNPKAAVFFSSVFAALLPPHVDWEYRTTIGIAIPAIGIAWYVLVACLFSAKRVAAAYARARRVVDAVTGTLFAVLAGDLVFAE
ncbi:LysE family transporter [Catenulispora sp. NF23]|uniref:LysE family transporter n=1 Tax=Catenulispora pinistramenti TaxID=2705254 RepID=UPI001BA7F7B5|nr:LysE family transporter [Catenulispora pinistramenti]MBS2538455.1 LysE family transporter [Catenulispora pinistramenti]